MPGRQTRFMSDSYQNLSATAFRLLQSLSFQLTCHSHLKAAGMCYVVSLLISTQCQKLYYMPNELGVIIIGIHGATYRPFTKKGFHCILI